MKPISPSSHRIAIIGGGAAGLAVIAHLLERFDPGQHKPIELVLFEKSDRIGPGLAYSATRDVNLINMPANTMGLYSKNPHHFLDWLQNNPHLWKQHFPHLNIDLDEHLPRRLYGIYLEEMSHVLKEKAQKLNISLHYYNKEVVDMQDEGEIFCLKCSDETFLQAHKLVLAIGSFASSSLRHLKGIQGYFPSPYPEEELIKNIPPTEDVCIVGSRLSAIDAILTLKAAHHQGKILCVSRSGRFPCVQGVVKDYKQEFLTEDYLKKLTKNGHKPLKINKLIALISKEVKNAEKKFFKWSHLREKASSKTLLKHEILQASGERPWQSAIRGKNKFFVALWQMLTEEDKRIILKKYFTYFLIFKAAFPLQSAKKLYQLMQRQELEVLPDLQNIDFDHKKGKFRIVFIDKVIETKYVIDATGRCSDVNLTDHKLVQNMVKRGYMTPHMHGGVCLNSQTLNIIDAYNQQNNRAYVLGTLACGVHLTTNVIEYIAYAADLVAKEIVKQL